MVSEVPSPEPCPNPETCSTLYPLIKYQLDILMHRITASTSSKWLALLKTVYAVGVTLALLFSSAEGTRLLPYPEAPASCECSGLDDSGYSYKHSIKSPRSSHAKSVNSDHGDQIVDVSAIALSSELDFDFAHVSSHSGHNPFSFQASRPLGPNETRGPPSA